MAEGTATGVRSVPRTGKSAGRLGNNPTGSGVFLALVPLAGASALLLFLALVVVTRYVSLGSIAAATAVPLLAAVYSRLGLAPPLTPATLALVVAAAMTVLFRHRANLGRLRAGTERRLGQGSRT